MLIPGPNASNEWPYASSIDLGPASIDEGYAPLMPKAMFDQKVTLVHAHGASGTQSLSLPSGRVKPSRMKASSCTNLFASSVIISLTFRALISA